MLFRQLDKKRTGYILLMVTSILVIGMLGYLRSGYFTEAQIEVTPRRYDFGRINPEPVSKSFKLTNTGEGPLLKISQISTSCSCTTAKVKERELPPDGSTELTVNFDPTAMDPPIRGEARRVIYIETNDRDQEETKIKITADVAGGEQVEEK